MNRRVKEAYPGNFGICQAQNAFPVGAVDKELVRLDDGGNVGPDRDIWAMRNGHQVSAQLSLPLPLRVGHVDSLP